MNRSRSRHRKSASAPPSYLQSTRSRRSNKPPPVLFNRYTKREREKHARFIEEYKIRKGLSPIPEGDESKPSPLSKKSQRSREEAIQLKSQPILTNEMINSKRYTIRSLLKGIGNKLGLRKTKSAR